MVAPSLKLCALLASCTPGPTDRQIDAARQKVQAVAGAIQRDHPKIELEDLTRPIATTHKSDLFTIKTKRISAAFYLESGELASLRVLQDPANPTPEGTPLGLSELKEKAKSYAVAAGHSPEPAVHQLAMTSFLLYPTWQGVEFARPSYTVSLTRSGNLLTVSSIYSSKLPQNPEPVEKTQRIDSLTATGLAGQALATHGLYGSPEIEGTKLVFFFKDLERVGKLADQGKKLSLRNSGLIQNLLLVLAPGRKYDRSTRLCYQVLIQTSVLPQGDGFRHLKWKIYVDAVTGEVINVELAPKFGEGKW